MKKEEIKNGAVVVLRNGMEFLKIDYTLLNLHMTGEFMDLDEYDNDMNFVGKNGNDLDTAFDIIKILNPEINDAHLKSCDTAVFNYRNVDFEWTWEREEKPEVLNILTPEEKEFLQTVIKLYGDKIKTIFVNGQCIYLKNAIALFSKLNYEILGLKFENVENYKEYTLEELGL